MDEDVEEAKADEEAEEDEELDLNDPNLLADEADPDQDLDELDAADGPDHDMDPDAEPDDDNGMGIFRRAQDQSAEPDRKTVNARAPQHMLVDGRDDAADAQDKLAGLSKHERQQLRMQERIARLEAQNMADKDWFMQGEAAACKHTFMLV